MGGSIRALYGRIVAVMAGMLMVSTALIGLQPSGPAGAANTAPINVGVVCSCTGPLASSITVGPPSYEAWAKSVNASGGINGHQVHVITVDDSFNSGTSLSEVENLVTSDHVVALVDSSDVDAAWGTYVQQHNVPVVGGGSSSQLYLTNPDFFAVGQTLDDYFINYIRAAQKVGAKNIAQFYCAEAATCQEGVPFLKKTAAAENFNVAYVTQVSASAPSYAAECIAAKQAGVQSLNVADAVSVVESVAADCQKQQFTPWQIALDGGVAKSFTTAPGIENKFIGSEPNIPFFTNSTPATQQMQKNLQKYAKSSVDSPNWNEQGIQMYASGLLLGQALKEVDAGKNGAVTTSDVLNGLYSLHKETLGGIAPPLTYTKGKPTPIDCWYWIRIQNGKFTTPYGIKPVCESPPPGTI